MDTLAILVAAGRGERMQAGRPKAFLDLAGRSLLRWSADAFDASPLVTAIVAVVPEGDERSAAALLSGVAKLHAIVPGGARRQDSVAAGLLAAPSGFDGVVLVHDAARPLVAAEVIAAVIAAVASVGAAIPVLPLVDTIKRVNDGRITSTVDRSELCAAQTPQGFRRSLLEEAYRAAERDGVPLTDEAMAVERLGQPVAAVAGAARNRKITTPDDLRWAEHLLAAEGASARATRA